MHRLAALAAIAIASSLAVPSAASDAGSPTPAGLPDYAQATNWVCRPEAESACTSGLDYAVENAHGVVGSPQRFTAAANPTIDCFYVYPTVSEEETDFSDLTDSPEIQDAANRQIGRLSSRCRVFAPLYRQITIAGLRKMMSGEIKGEFDASFSDIAAAWAYYLAHDNGGRGVVLVGHSQGTILLQRLIASTIDGTPQQKLLVSAFLAGDPSLAVPMGKKVGGTFKHVPVCSSKSQVGCAYVWGSYLSGDSSPLFTFGTPLDGGLTSACENPAAPSGGVGKLEFFHKKAMGAPASDPPWVETVGLLSGACRSDSTGSGFIVTVAPGPRAAHYKTSLKRSEIFSGWGLHLVDVGLVLGNVLDVLDAEIATLKTRDVSR